MTASGLPAVPLLNPAVDVAAAQNAYARHGFVVLRDFLHERVADALADALASALPWEFWSRGPQGTVVVASRRWRAMTPQERASLIPPHPDSVAKFHYAYERISPTPTEADGAQRVLLAFFEAINSVEYRSLMGRIIGHAIDVHHVDGAWSRYGPRNFLSPHTDANRDQVRLAAHVLGLTRRWDPRWGGNLSLCTPQGREEALLPPSFNTLVLFSVPRWHFVSPVREAAQVGRFSFFGWLVEKNLAARSTERTQGLA